MMDRLSLYNQELLCKREKFLDDLIPQTIGLNFPKFLSKFLYEKSTGIETQGSQNFHFGKEMVDFSLCFG